MKSMWRRAGACMLICICCLLSGCRKDALETVHTAVCETVGNTEQCYARFSGVPYRSVEIAQELAEILDPAHWEPTRNTATDTPYYELSLPGGKLTFYEGNLLCITVAQTNEPVWYVSENEVYEQIARYTQRYGYQLPSLEDDDCFVQVCR